MMMLRLSHLRLSNQLLMKGRYGKKRGRFGKRVRAGSPTPSRKRVRLTLPTPTPEATPTPEPTPELTTTPEMPFPVSMSYYTTNFKEIEMIGKGSYGSVYACKNLIDGHKYAVKKVNIFARDQWLIREVKLLAMLDHPNIIRYYQAWMEPSDSDSEEGSEEEYVLYIVMELCEKTLKSIVERKEIRVHQALDYAIQLMDGLSHMHAKQIMHRDIWPDNIFISYSGLLKIADFGLGRHLGDKSGIYSSVIGQVDYVAPEVLEGEEIDYTSDVYSCGMICLAMLCPGVQVEERKKMVSKFQRKEKTKIDPVFGLLSSLLSQKPDSRDSAAVVLKYFRQSRSNSDVISNLKEVRKWWIRRYA